MKAAGNESVDDRTMGGSKQRRTLSTDGGADRHTVGQADGGGKRVNKL